MTHPINLRSSVFPSNFDFSCLLPDFSLDAPEKSPKDESQVEENFDFNCLLPDFSLSAQEKTPKSRKALIPMSPCLRPLKRTRKTHRYEKIANSIFTGKKFCINSIMYTLTSFIGRGSFMNVYELQSQGNQDLVLKVFNAKRKKDPEKILTKYLTNSFQQYQSIRQELAVASIVNNPIDDGFIAQKKIPFSLDLSNVSQVDQIRKFFQFALEKMAYLDLAYSNFCVDHKGKVILIDFMEDFDDLQEYNPLRSQLHPVIIDLKRALKTFEEKKRGISKKLVSEKFHKTEGLFPIRST